MTELILPGPNQTLPSGGIAVALLLLHAASSIGVGYGLEPVIKLPTPEIGIETKHIGSGSSESSLQLAVDSEVSAERLFAQMEGLFRQLVESQAAVEPEYYPALYESRSDMYTLF